MTELKVASDNATIDVGPGNRWVDVYTALSDYGLYCIRGRLKTISVPSLELIRRFHYLINKYSMTIDNVLSYDVVLRNGTRVIANSTSNPDLFWALKGGANNFSIVTKFTIKTLPIPLISTTIQQLNESAVPDFSAPNGWVSPNFNEELPYPGLGKYILDQVELVRPTRGGV
jgi:hypothetical protein